MATFNAGAIEARLTLDRSSFSNELRAAKAQADEFERDEINVGISLGSIREEIAHVREELYRLSQEHINISAGVTLHTGRAHEEIARLQRESISIMATLWLDDEDARAKLRRWEDERIHIPANIDVDGGAALVELEAILRRLDGKNINVDLNLDAGAAITEIATLESMIDRLSSTINIDLDLGDSLNELATIEALIQGLPTSMAIDLDITAALMKLDIFEYALLFAHTLTKFNLELDTAKAELDLAALEAHLIAFNSLVAASGLGGVGGAGGGGISGGGGGGGWIMMVLKILLALAPAVVASIAGLTAVIIGFAGALAGAIGGLAILGAGLIPTVIEFTKGSKEIQSLKDKLEGLDKKSKEYKETAKELAAAQDAFNKKFGGLNEALDQAKETWASFQEVVQPTAILVLSGALDVFNTLIPRIAPLFELFAGVILEAMDSVKQFMKSPEMDRLIAYFSTVGVHALAQFLKIGGNLLLFFGRLFEAFGPFTTAMMDSLVRITAGWADFADGLGKTNGFQEFIDYVYETGPKVLDMLGSMIAAFIEVGKALAPFAGPVLATLTGFFDLIANAPVGLLQGLAIALGAVLALVTIHNVAVGAYNKLMLAWDTIQKVVTAGQWLLNAAMSANPITLIVIGIGLLVAAFVLLWNHSEGFRNFWHGFMDDFQSAWNDAWDMMSPVIDVIKAAFNGIVGAAEWLYDVLLGHSIIPDIVNGILKWFNALVTLIMAPVNLFKTVVEAGFKAVQIVLQTIFEVIKTVITTYFQVYQTIIGAVVGTIKTVISAAWDAIKIIFTAALDIIKAVLTGNFGAIPGIVSGALGQLKGVISGAWDTIKGIWSGALDKIKSLLSTAFDKIKSAASTGMDALITLVTGLPGRIIAALGNVGTMLYDVGKQIIQGMANGIRDFGGIVADAAKNAAKAAFDAAKDFLHIGSPSKLFHQLGMWTGEGLANGLDKSADGVAKAALSMLDALDIAGMQGGGDGYIQTRLGIDSGAPSVTVQAPPAPPPPPMDALLAENRALRETMERMIEEFRRQTDNQLVLARQGATRG